MSFIRSSGLLLDIRLAPTAPSGPCKPPNPNLPAISGRAVDAATGRGLAGLTVGVAPLVLNPTTGMVDPGPIAAPSFGPSRGLFAFQDPGPIANGFQLFASAPGHGSLGAVDPGPISSPGVTVLKDPGPISLPAGTGSMTVGVVITVALPAVQ